MSAEMTTVLCLFHVALPHPLELLPAQGCLLRSLMFDIISIKKRINFHSFFFFIQKSILPSFPSEGTFAPESTLQSYLQCNRCVVIRGWCGQSNAIGH